ncbi:MAG: glycerol-3-phosphate 1-O-acyltransferase PlsY [Acetobacter sp.]|nr:glycerol-3-phosphate 1-O-acyltransferase PlsY [Acetobacter sp.]
MIYFFHNNLCVFIVTGIFSYLLGSIPFGPLFTRFAGLGDLRHIGSGNTGATNVLRTGRKGLAAATLLLDAAKGSIAVILTSVFFPHLSSQTSVIAALAAVIGHCYSVFLGFRGGKGVATGLGALLALSPTTGLFGCATWLCVAWITRISSAGALAAFIFMPIVASIKYGFSLQHSFIPITTFLISAFVVTRHHSNITRILSGKESKISTHKQTH